MKIFLFLFILTSSFTTIAQNAEFGADLGELSQRIKGNDELFKKAMKWEWKINGKSLSFGSGTIKIKLNRSKLDTILFRKSPNSNYDTILTNVTNSFEYNFEYNTCCDYFNVRALSDPKRTKNRQKSIVSFEILNNKENKKYLGIIGEAGIIIKEDNKEYELFYTCSSAMSSNIYRVSLNEFEECQDDTKCRELSCIFENKKFQVPHAESDFQILSEKIGFLYLPLGIQSLKINLDLKNDKLKIKNVW